MPRGTIGGGEPSLLELAFHGAYGRKLVGYMLDQFSEISLFVVFIRPSTAHIGYCKLAVLVMYYHSGYPVPTARCEVVLKIRNQLRFKRLTIFVSSQPGYSFRRVFFATTASDRILSLYHVSSATSSVDH